MGVKVTIDYSVYSGGVWSRTTGALLFDSDDPENTASIGRRPLQEALPRLVQQVERNLCEFTSGDISFVCENDTNFWTPTSLQSAIGVTCTSGPFLTTDPYTDWWHGDTNNRPAVIKIYVDGWMRWQGDIDPKTVTYNFKNRTVSFTATGPLKRLATYNAEDLRRDIPRYGYIGKVTAVTTVSAGTSYKITDSGAAWPVNRFVGQILIRVVGDAYSTCHTITANDATTITYASNEAHFATNNVYVIRPMSFETPGDVVSAETGTSTTSSVDCLRLGSDPGWSTDQWKTFHFTDGQGTEYGPITSNDSNTLNFDTATAAPYDAGAITIFHKRLLRTAEPESGHGTRPTVCDWSLEAKDKLVITPKSVTTYAAERPEPWIIRTQSKRRRHYFDGFVDYKTQEVTISDAPLDTGTATGGVGASGTLIDNTKTWTTDEWAGCWMYNYTDGETYPIASNTATQLTCTGTFTNPAGDVYTILKYQYPTLGPYEIWLDNDLDSGDEANPCIVTPLDAVTCTTPYYRDVTITELAGHIFDALTGLSWKIKLDPYTNGSAEAKMDYFDCDGKSMLEVISELAVAYNAVLGCRIENDVLYFVFWERESGIGPVKTLTPYLCDAEVMLTWDQSCQAVKATGADSMSVIRGAPRYGSSILEVSTDFVSSGNMLRRIAERLDDQFNVQRQAVRATVLAEGFVEVYEHFNTGPSEWGNCPAGWTAFLGNTTDWAIVDSSMVWTRTVADSTVLQCWYDNVVGDYAILDGNAGAMVDSQMQVDLRTDGYGVGRWGLIFRASGASHYRLTAQADASGGSADVTLSSEAADLVISTCTLTKNKWYRLKANLAGSTIQWKVWEVGTTEPGWQYNFTGLTIRSGGVGTFAHSSGDDMLAFDNFSAGLGKPQLLDVVSFIDPSIDQWIVTRIDEPLLSPGNTVEIEGYALTGTQYTPSDYDELDLDTSPEPPIITGVASYPTTTVVSMTWSAGDRDLLAYFLVMVWRSEYARPETGERSYVPVYTGSGTWTVTIDEADWGIAPDNNANVKVDVAAVSVNGQLGWRSDPYAYGWTVA